MPGADRARPGRLPGGPKILFTGRNAEPDSGPARASDQAPRVLFPGGAPASPPEPARPRGGEATPVVPFGAPRQPPPQNQPPTVLAGGIVRRRIPCSPDALRQVDAAATPATLREAQRIVESVNLDDAYFDDVLRFGAQLQQEHAALAEAELALANAAAVQEGQAALTRIMQTLDALDPRRLFAATQPTLGDKLKALLDAPRPPGDIFAEQYPRLRARAEELKRLEPALLEHARGMQALAARYRALAQGLAEHLLAGRFLIQHIRAHPAAEERQDQYTAQADALETRLASLLATRATLEVGSVNNELLLANTRGLIAAGRGLLEEDLPTFHTAYTAALNAAAQATPGAEAHAGARSVHDVHARVMTKLRGGTP